MEDARRDPVADANLDKLGLLGADIAADVVRFYTMLKGIRADLVNLSTESRIDHCVKLLKEDLDLWDDVKSMGASLQKRLENI